ncbi:MAG: Shikimate dehydrogenase [Thermodesulfobacterium sp. 37_54]|jgi:shikimate dehydrogenase|uniref:Shikimate dehydrogenase (NADP(+)) n=1 Tax=Thermodesulfobacterium commune TaxID=1741 RepID=A0A101FKF2_9BACT|nr:MAG: Shikimate dehydrogenase [Thermodesulfobacterium sp. 37_54]KUK19817.1 MAG: Shikimate dehydrogenase [Thermodesulfobacterium commune]MDK2861035.1 shikimate dehydrogenase [Thermodesulfobacterium sp.]KUK38660.1 MAG: Shikimate dehydrogenase [Thermodesulfobacterium commune]HAA84606.1 shikimate dehydrogenase [Thermodesulfobacterium commune]
MYDVYGVIGYPVKHSLSPVIHNLGFKLLGLKSVYGTFEVSPENFEQAVIGIKALGIQGLSVTVPYKERIMKYLDEIDKTSSEIGAVNTVMVEEGRLLGFNTDWIGVLKAFEENGISLKGKQAVVIGAGGAAKAVVYAVKEAGAKEIVIYNRTYQKAVELAQKFGGVPKPWDELNKAEGEIIIQTTSVGLNSKESVVGPEVLLRFKVAMDLVYSPLKTTFLTYAEEKGCKVIDGLQMLFYQGIEQLRLWTKKSLSQESLSIIQKELYAEVQRRQA